MSNCRTPSGSASGFYGSHKSAQKRSPQLQGTNKRSTGTSVTPARNQTSLPRRNANFYGPGVLLEDLNETEYNDSASEVDEHDFDFGDSQGGQQMEPYDRELSHSPELPLNNHLSNYACSGADSHSSRSQNEVIPMLQQQQMILEKVLVSQKAIEDRQNDIEDKLADLQDQLDKQPVPSPSSSSSSSDGKRKRLVTRALSVSLFAYT